MLFNRLKSFNDSHTHVIALSVKVFIYILVNISIMILSLKTNIRILFILSLIFSIFCVVSLIFCVKTQKYIDFISFSLSLCFIILCTESFFSFFKSTYNLERNFGLFVIIVVFNEKYRKFMLQLVFLIVIFVYLEIKNFENSFVFYIEAILIFLSLLIYVYQYLMNEKNLMKEKQLASENQEFVLLYNSIIKNYPTSLIIFEKNVGGSNETPKFEWKFSNNIARNEFHVNDSESLNGLFENIQLNTGNLFDLASCNENFERKQLKKHLNESCVFNEIYEESPKKIPKIKKFLTFYRRNPLTSPLNSERFLCEASENANKYRVCLIKFYHKDKINYLLNIEDIHLEEEVIHLREIDKSKDEMLASITHDLRSPLSSMLKCIEFAKESTDLVENHHNLELAASSGQMLMNLINDLLDYSLMKKGKFQMHYSYFTIEKLISETVDMMKIQGNLKNIHISSQNNCHPHFTIYSDFMRIKQVLVNLLSNSLKFTKTGGKILIEISQISEQKLILFTVTDNGVGIKPEIIPKLCQPYKSFDYDGAYNKQGIGLGLHICTNIITQLGPEKALGIESVYGKYAKFSFILYANCSFKSELRIDIPNKIVGPSVESLPFARELCSENASFHKIPCSITHKNNIFCMNTDKSPQNNEDFPIKLVNQSLKRSISHQDPMAGLRDYVFFESKFNIPCKLSVLLAEDDVFTSMLFKKMLMKFPQEHTKISLEIETAFNGEEALQAFERRNAKTSENPFDLVFLDCVMPIKDGFETASALKKLITERGFAKCPIIGCSAWQDSKKCLESGMDEVLLKPVEIGKVFEILTSLYVGKVNN